MSPIYLCPFLGSYLCPYLCPYPYPYLWKMMVSSGDVKGLTASADLMDPSGCLKGYGYPAPVGGGFDLVWSAAH